MLIEDVHSVEVFWELVKLQRDGLGVNENRIINGRALQVYMRGFDIPARGFRTCCICRSIAY